ncbi:MAG: hypothetical protein JWQ79_2863 [Mucilaginibacter sp.]|jgi:hypothetical protein|nr:hypothetical protein [Mucilaginibacter sp.]
MKIHIVYSEILFSKGLGSIHIINFTFFSFQGIYPLGP